MIKHTCVNLTQLSNDGKKFKWDRPIFCSCCGHKLWCHGYVGRYFDGFIKKLWLKRLRCPKCRIVITMMPSGIPKYYQGSFFKIFFTLTKRLNSYSWPPWITRQRGGHWLRKLKSYCLSHFGVNENSLNLKEKLPDLYTSDVNFLSS